MAYSCIRPHNTYVSTVGLFPKPTSETVLVRKKLSSCASQTPYIILVFEAPPNGICTQLTQEWGLCEQYILVFEAPLNGICTQLTQEWGLCEPSMIKFKDITLNTASLHAAVYSTAPTHPDPKPNPKVKPRSQKDFHYGHSI